MEEILEKIKEKLIESIKLSNTEGIDIDRIVNAFVRLKRLEVEISELDTQDEIIIRYIEEKANE
jgi:hypothetical protein